MGRTPARAPNQHPDYESLPKAIKMALTEAEYCWIGREQRETLQESMTSPEVYDDAGT